MTYDVVIIGAGPAGITTAMELSRSGMSIALVESGGLDFDPDTQELYDGVVTGLDAVDLMAIRLRMFGGTSNHWGGHCVPLDNIDFTRAPLSGFSGWPFERTELIPFYERAHPYCDLGDFDYARDAAEGVGPDDFILYDDPRIETSVLRQSLPTQFGEKYYETLNAAPKLDVHLMKNAVRLVSDADGVFTGVDVMTFSGETEQINGKSFVIACGAVETARLMMVSNVREGKTFGAAGGLLGKCYMDHIAGGAGFIGFQRPAGNKVYWRHELKDKGGTPLHHVLRLSDEVLEEENLPNAHFYVIPFPKDADARQRTKDAKASLNGLKNIAKWGLGRSPNKFSLSKSYCDFITKADSFAAETWDTKIAGKPTERVLLKYEIEQLPERQNNVSLMSETDALGQPKAALNWSPSLRERDAIVQTAIYIGRLCGEANLGRLELEDHFDTRYWDAGTSWHQLGTTRMSTSPTEGVVDAQCRVHGTRNLYVASGSVMPSVGRANPTLTIVALSIRLADHLKQVMRSL